MNLYLHELTHLLFSLLIGFIIWKRFHKNISVFVAALLGGFFIDLDHLFDYFIAFGNTFNFLYFFKGYAFLKTDKIYVLFHSWELVAILLCLSIFYYFYSTNSTNLTNLTKHALMLAFALSLFFHLSTDVVVDHMKVQSYSLVYRVSNNFDLKSMVTPSHYRDHLLRKNLVTF